MKYFYLLIVMAIFFNASRASARDYNIKAFGAVGNGSQMNTAQIQAAIDACAKNGGGRVLIPEGRFLSGSLHLKSGVDLYLEKNAVLLGSSKRADYEKNASYALILADGQNNIGIEGHGSIDGQGRELAADVIRMWKAGLLTDNKGSQRPDEKYRPGIIDLEGCRNVHISGVTIKDASCWVQTYRKCRRLYIKNVTVISTAYWNNDGFDLVDCDSARVSRCNINSADDGICLKSDDSTSLCQNISIKNCRVRSSASAIKFGTASLGGFKNIKVKNIYVYDTYRSAVALECVDGGILKNIFVNNIKATNTGNAIFIRLGKRNKDNRHGNVDNITISNVNAAIPIAKPDKGYELEGPPDKEPYNTLPSSVVGIAGSYITNITLKHIKISYEGGYDGVSEVGYNQNKSVPERVPNYPEFSMFGELPAWGFYLRHVSGITFKDIKLSCGKTDYRPAFVVDDVKNIVQEQVFLIDGAHKKREYQVGN